MFVAPRFLGKGNPSTFWPALANLVQVTSLCEGSQRTSTEYSWTVDKYNGPILRRLLTKVHEILEQHRCHSRLPTPFPIVYMARFFSKIFAIKSQSRRKTNNEVFRAQFFSRWTTPNFSRQIVSAIYFLPSGIVSFADLRMRSMAIK